MSVHRVRFLIFALFLAFALPAAAEKKCPNQEKGCNGAVCQLKVGLAGKCTWIPRELGGPKCKCFGKPPKGGGGERTSSRYVADDVAVPAPGETVELTFTLDPTYDALWVEVELHEDIGGGVIEVPVISGEVTLAATGAEDGTVSLDLIDSLLVGDNVELGIFGDTGLNVLRYTDLRGILDPDSGVVELTGIGTIVNERFGEDSPILVESFIDGTFDAKTGSVTLLSSSLDHFPDNEGASGVFFGGGK